MEDARGRLTIRFAYLIMAHQGVDQLQCLLARLLRDDPEDIIILHVDRKSDIADSDLVAIQNAHENSRILVTPRIDCSWGHPSLCEAILLLMNGLQDLDYDYAHLISGQDWPIVSKSAMVNDIRPGACYIDIEGRAMDWRMNGFHFHNFLISPNDAQGLAERLVRTPLIAAGMVRTKLAEFSGTRRRCPFGPAWKKGEAWWSLPREAVQWLRQSVEVAMRGGRLKYTVCSDEHLPQTLLAYSSFADVIEHNHRFVIRRDAKVTATLSRDDLPALRSSGSWFARKCDLSRDPFFLSL